MPVDNRVHDGEIPLFGSNGIIDHHNTWKAKEGVITGRSGTLGQVYYSETPFWPLNTTLFSVDTHGNNVIYLKHLLERFDLARFGAGSGVPTLNRNNFHEEQIIDVPLKEQRTFAAKVKQIDKLRFNYQRQIEVLQELLAAKMEAYFGE